MKILIRLPNWLGDMVMAAGFINALRQLYPEAEISVIAKKGIHGLLEFFPPLVHQFVFDKAEFKGLAGAWQFGRNIRKVEKFDLFFCLPDSFSSAVMARATGAGKIIGFKKEWRNILLTRAYKKPEGFHRVDEYIALLELFAKKKAGVHAVTLQQTKEKEDYVVVNINSEAASRRLTIAKALEMINALRAAITEKIVLIGAPKEKAFIDAVYDQLTNRGNIENVAGQTSLTALAQLLASARLLLTTDSGPAHVANAFGTHTMVLFGAGNEANTAPYNKADRTIIRLGQLSCEPCRKNVCVRFGIPQCLERLNTAGIIQQAVTILKQTK